MSRSGLLQDRVLQCLIGHQPLQTCVLLLQLLQTLRLVGPHPAALLTPAAIRLIGYADLLAHLARRQALRKQHLRFGELRCGLLGRELLRRDTFLLFKVQAAEVYHLADRPNYRRWVNDAGPNCEQPASFRFSMAKTRSISDVLTTKGESPSNHHHSNRSPSMKSLMNTISAVVVMAAISGAVQADVSQIPETVAQRLPGVKTHVVQYSLDGTHSSLLKDKAATDRSVEFLRARGCKVTVLHSRGYYLVRYQLTGTKRRVVKSRKSAETLEWRLKSYGFRVRISAMR